MESDEVSSTKFHFKGGSTDSGGFPVHPGERPTIKQRDDFEQDASEWCDLHGFGDLSRGRDPPSLIQYNPEPVPDAIENDAARKLLIEQVAVRNRKRAETRASTNALNCTRLRLI